MNSKQRQAAELEAELVRLNSLVRARRQQLARLETCPHKTCECRLLWRDHVEKQLATQVRKIRKHVRNGAPATNGTPRGRSRKLQRA
jgi:hypothetical protein